MAMPRRGGAASPVATARDKLVRGVLSPFNPVVITRRNLEEVLDDAVRRGRMTRTDAQDMIQTLVTRGARVTDDILAEIQRMLGNAEALDTESRADVATNTRRLPISDYDELSAAQVQERLDGLDTCNCGTCASTSSATRTARRFSSGSTASCVSRSGRSSHTALLFSPGRIATADENRHVGATNLPEVRHVRDDFRVATSPSSRWAALRAYSARFIAHLASAGT